jgi:hypothetical protein
MDWFNRALTRAFDLLLRPLGALQPVWGLAAAAVLAGVAMVWLFGKVSNQRRIRTLKRTAKGRLLEMWIFRDNLRVVLVAQGRLLWDTGKYALCSAQALLVVMIPVVPIMVQLQARYGWRPLSPGESTILKVVYRGPRSLDEMDVRLGLPEGVRLEAPPLRIPEDGEVDFRLAGEREGRYEIAAELNGQTLTKSLQVGRSSWADPLSPLRGGGLLDRLLHPVEPPLPDGPVKRIEVRYAAAEIPFCGWRLHWLWPFLVLSILAGFALKGRLGVEL